MTDQEIWKLANNNSEEKFVELKRAEKNKLYNSKQKCITETSKKYNVTVLEILGKSGTKYIAEARQFTAYLLRYQLFLTFSEIGTFLNITDSYARYGTNKIKNKIKNNQLLIDEE
jgi:chromosomal replication initiation ATPase DnaA